MFQKVLHALPSYLPRTEEEFDLYCKDVFKTWGYPDMPGYRKLIAQCIQHMGQTTVKASKRELAKVIRKAQVNELAYYMMKAADAAAKAEQEKETLSKTEATQQDTKAAEPTTIS